MGTRGRKSAAELGVIPGIPQRPEPPDELTPQQAEEWREIVDRMPVDWFRREIHPLLCAYCRHICNARHIAGLIEDARVVDVADRKAVMRYNRFLGSNYSPPCILRFQLAMVVLMVWKGF